MTKKWVVPALALVLMIAVAPAVAEESSKRPSRDYVIGVEDVLRVVTWGEPELTLTVKVRPDGKITVPLVNDIMVEGRTSDQVRLIVTEKLSEFIKEPHVTVIVDQINSFRIYCIGEVNTQGAINLYRPTRLLQAVASAGGLTTFSRKEIILLREVGGAELRIPIDYKKLLQGDPSQENLLLRSGDTLLFR